MALNRKRIFIISGPSGSGKTSLLKRILGDKALGNRLARSISYTTRPKRSKEKDSRDYIFISAAEFRQKIKAQKLLEWTRYLGYYYGTPRNLLERQLNKAQGVLLCLDVKGAFNIKRLYPKDTVTIFVTPPSLQHLPERIKKRCKKTGVEEIKRRLRLAREEVRASKTYDYRLTNERLNQAAKQLKTIIIKEMES